MIAILVLLMGVVWGSFVNALVWRIRVQEDAAEASSDTKPSNTSSHQTQGRPSAHDYSILRGRSMCPRCHHKLAAKDLVPILSWLQLHGRCRYCRKPISLQYPLVELLTGLVFVIFYLGWQFSLSGLHLVWFLYGLAYLVFFVALAVYDFKWMLLPDRLVFPLTALALSQALVSGIYMQSWDALWQPFAGAGIIFSIFWGIYQLSDGEWIGGGDVKLAVPLGLIAGTPLRALLVVFIASLIGTITSLPGLIRAKQTGWTRHIPFGPYLLAGCLIVMLWADKIVTWYQGMLL